MQRAFTNLLQLVNVKGKIQGRKRLQKIVYILKNKGFDFEEHFNYHYYGPYSSVLQMEVDELVQAGLLAEEKISNTFEYSLTDHGDNFVLGDFYTREQTALIEMLTENSTSVLELASVFFYLENSGYSDKKAMIRKVEILKPELHNYLDDAWTLYSEV